MNSANKLQNYCVRVYYEQLATRMIQLRQGFRGSLRTELSYEAAQRIIDEARGLYNPLWAIRLEIEIAIGHCRMPKLSDFSYKKAAKYAHLAETWAPLQRRLAESSVYALTKLLQAECAVFGIEPATAVQLVKEATAIDPVVELTYRHHRRWEISQTLRDLGVAHYNFFPAIYAEIPEKYRTQHNLVELFEVDDALTGIDRAASVGRLFSAKSNGL